MVIINPGTGDVSQFGDDVSEENAERNIAAFAEELAAIGVRVTCAGPLGDDGQGRWNYDLHTGPGRVISVSMPGLRLGLVRGDDRDVHRGPRLYVNGSSWWWPYAIGVCVPDDDG